MTHEIAAEYDFNKVSVDDTNNRVIITSPGPQGIPGSYAAQGIQGTQGIQGSLGIQGPSGSVAAQGIQGPQGIQGLSGTGTQGIQGIAGSVQGIQGLQGIQGIIGSQGTQGIQGIQGVKGDQGNPGVGIQGTTGTTGEQGLQGIQGPVGISVQGIQGVQGPQGIQGGLGVQGIQGTDGAYSAQGIQGIQGVQGAGALVLDAVWTPYGTPVFADEFNNASLDASWTQVDNAAHVSYVSWIEAADVLSVRHTSSADGNGEMHAMLRPVGTSFSPGDAVVTAVKYAGPYATNYTMMGVGVTNGTTWGTDNIVQAQVYVNSAVAGPGTVRVNVNAGMNADTAYSSTLNVNPIGGLMWLRLVMTAANTWRFDFSADGVQWYIGNSLTYTLTPTHMGLFVRNWTQPVQSVVSFEFFRRYSGIS